MDPLHALAGAVDTLTAWLDGQCPGPVTGYSRVVPAAPDDAAGWFLVSEGTGSGARAGAPMAGDATVELVVDVSACAGTAAKAAALFDLLDERLTRRNGSGAFAYTPDVGAGLTVLERAADRGPLDVVGGVAQRAATYTLTLHRTV